jgi:hypothetical protein
VTTDAGHEVIKPYHKSLADWLADKKKAGVYFVSVIDGHLLLANCGWKAFKHALKDIPNYLLIHLPHHLVVANRVDDLCEILVEPAYLAMVRSTGRITELLSFCDELLERRDLFSSTQHQLVSFLLQSTPEESLAQKIHAMWISGPAKRPEIQSAYPDRLSPWKSLARQDRAREWEKVSEIFQILKNSGFAVQKPTKNPPQFVRFTEEELESLAEAEHDRWCRERFAEGWTYGKLDHAKHTHPRLVPWSEFPEKFRNYDREACLAWPELFAKGGYEIQHSADKSPPSRV